MHSLKRDMLNFERLIKDIKPNILLIGSMTLSLPGAIACAKKTKEILGSEVCIILGGRHINETIYPSNNGHIVHHTGSPCRLIMEKYIEPVFDLVISGEAEHVITKIGEKIDYLDKQKIKPNKINKHLKDIEYTPGRWIISHVYKGKIFNIQSKNIPINRNLLPSPCEMFGINTSFNVFKDSLTAHVFSDIGNGCIYNCSFCSEAKCITEPFFQPEKSSERLFKQFQSAIKVINEDSPSFKASAFIEDSTMLFGSNKYLQDLFNLLNKTNLDIKFGGQLTIDQIIKKVDILRNLKKVGLDYIFTGVETLDPNDIGGLSKNVMAKNEEWRRRAKKAIEVLHSLNIDCGISIVFGLGETYTNRINLFKHIESWRREYNSPNVIGINWAVQHPLRGNDGGINYRYHKWGIPSGLWIDAFEDFGEASVRYPIFGQKKPVFSEVEEIKEIYNNM